MKTKDPLTDTQATGLFLLYHTEGKEGYLSVLSFLLKATACPRQVGNQFWDLEG